MNEENENKKKPPLGVVPESLWFESHQKTLTEGGAILKKHVLEQRTNELSKAIAAYVEQNLNRRTVYLAIIWTNELQRHLQSLEYLL